MKKIILLLVAISLNIIVFSQTIRYVKPSASGTGDGSSWANASNNLQAMINASERGDFVYVAQGTYIPQYTASGYNCIAGQENYPNTSGGRDDAFVIKLGVKIYGGFPATGDPNLNDRDWENNVTILSGGTSNQKYHVVIAPPDDDANDNTQEAILDGFTICNGNADGGTTQIYLNGATEGIQRRNGGGIYALRSNMTFENIIVKNNHADYQGGGLVNFGNEAIGHIPYGNTTYDNISFISNTANTGGACVLKMRPIIKNASFKNNQALDGNGGAIFVENGSTAQPQIVNAILSGNYAKEIGGAIYVSSMANISLTNVTIAGNYARERGGGIGVALTSPNNGSANLINSIVWGNGTQTGNDPNAENAGCTRSIVQDKSGEWPQCEDINPLFVNPTPANQAPNTSGNYQLRELSPAISAADTNAYKNAMGLIGNNVWEDQFDMAGQTRLVYNDLDLGAFEMQNPIRPQSDSKIVYVKPGGTGNKKGSSWANAYPNLSDILYYASYHNYMSSPNDSIAQIWVVQGEYKATGSECLIFFNDRNRTFLIPEKVKVYGAFRTNANDLEDTIPAVRGSNLGDMTLSILSGDIGNINDISDNCHHVVLAVNTINNQITFDGFKITGGNANGVDTIKHRKIQIPQNTGGGLCIVNSYSPYGNFSEINNLIIENNQALENGGGIANIKTKTKFKNIIVRGNYSRKGAGIFNNNANYSKYLQSVVYGNKAIDTAGGVLNYQSSNLLFLNSSIGGNNFEGMYNQNSNPEIRNTIISGNDTSLVNDMSVPICSFSLIEGCQTNNTWNSNFGNNQGNNIGLPAKFTNLIDPSIEGWSQNTNGDYRIKGSSPAINNASISIYQNEFGLNNLDSIKDIINNDRLISENIDMGAYEMLVFNVNFAGINVNIPTQLVAINDIVEIPEEPTRNGYYFAGWYSDSLAVENLWDFPNNLITQDTTLYAKWTEIVYHNVEFAGINVSINPQYIEHGLFASEPDEPTRNHYNFAGWFTDNQSFQNQWNFNQDPVINDIILYAKWDAILYDVNFAGTDIDIPTQQVQEENLVVEPAEPQRQHYNFDGWFTDDETFINQWNFNFDVVTKDTTLYAKWTAIDLFVTFFDDTDSLYQQTVQSGNLAIRPEDPTKNSYQFAGWYLDNETFTNHFDFYNQTIIADINLYAKWIEISQDTIYKVNFLNDTIEIAEPQYISINGYANSPTQPTNPHHDFQGWYSDNNTFANAWLFESYAIYQDTTLYSKWTLTDYTVSFAGENINIPNQILNYGDLIEKPNDPTRTGYTFEGWFSDNNTFVNAWLFDSYTIHQDTTLYAKWTINNYTVSFAGENINIPNQILNYGDLIEKPNDPIRTGYTFEGWFSDNNTFVNAWLFDSYTIYQDTTLYAKWTIITNINEEQNSYTIHPNPANDYIIIDKLQENQEINIVDILGKTIKTTKIKNNTINISDLKTGIYFIKINEKIYKFVKE